MSSISCVTAGITVSAVALVAGQSNANEACADLASFMLQDVRIKTTEKVDAGTPHCKIAGVIEKEINFELLLPNDWNGRFMMGGGGAYVGSIQNQALAYGSGPGALERGYATVGTDTGHVSSMVDGSWALNNVERQENFGHRAVHLTAVTAKAIIERYYARAPEYSYFVGCSRGGGQAMMETQRYPEDFDGLVAGAPAYDWTGFRGGQIRTLQTMFPDGHAKGPVLTDANLELLGTTIIAACDARDGVADGILTDPRDCPFEPDDLKKCEGDARADCVTTGQLAAIKAIYDAPSIDGRRLFAGFPYGGEHHPRGWAAWMVGLSPSFAFAIDFYQNFVFSDPHWDYTHYDFADWKQDVAKVSAMLDATSIDLSEFKKRDGRIIFWTGWSDHLITALGTVDYYDKLTAADPDADEYSRLYMLPGMFHCAGGPAPDRADWLEAIRAWVEDGKAPERLVSLQLDESGTVSRTRPICPYPQVASYRGEGDPDDEASFACQ
ncbi:MAG: tannase/feruloyl esterase family alpha/beta hydrolase [Gammaproteobacteria bacterium]|nr:tannase/feruloyl esterase family alpha/beta hydrolase [Gammaproteobacteria bacterium]